MPMRAWQSNVQLFQTTPRKDDFVGQRRIRSRFCKGIKAMRAVVQRVRSASVEVI